MGSCVSVPKDTDSAVKLRLSVGSKNDNFLIPSPLKLKPDTLNSGDRTLINSHPSPPHFPDAGSKDDAFFDSQPWLESDCEDDFLSVNGDFTASSGSTPVHHRFSSGVNKAPVVEAVTESSPPKKRLFELFKESLRVHDQYVDEEKDAVLGNERTPDGVLRTEEKSLKSTQCCLPMLRTSRSFSERKKKTSPPCATG